MPNYLMLLRLSGLRRLSTRFRKSRTKPPAFSTPSNSRDSISSAAISRTRLRCFFHSKNFRNGKRATRVCRRIQIVYSRSRQRRSRRTANASLRHDGEGKSNARFGEQSDDFSRERSAALARCRSSQSEEHGRAAQQYIRHAADLSWIDIRERSHALWSHLSRHSSGRLAISFESGRHSLAEDAK